MSWLRAGSVLTTAGILAGVALAGTAADAAALGTLPCDKKGTTGNDIIHVSVPANRVAPFVVCPASGTDTVIIDAVQVTAPATQLYIAMGNGDKTVHWNAGDVDWGGEWAGPMSGLGLGNGIITRPESNSTIELTGLNSGQSIFACGTNVGYRAATDIEAFYLNNGSRYTSWQFGATFNSSDC